jgi:hypothetical protein
MKRWPGKPCDILLFFDKRAGFPLVDGSLVGKSGDSVRLTEQPEGLLTRLRAWLGW